VAVKVLIIPGRNVEWIRPSPNGKRPGFILATPTFEAVFFHDLRQPAETIPKRFPILELLATRIHLAVLSASRTLGSHEQRYKHFYGLPVYRPLDCKVDFINVDLLLLPGTRSQRFSGVRQQASFEVGGQCEFVLHDDCRAFLRPCGGIESVHALDHL
jgi:hypothetical protein